MELTDEGLIPVPGLLSRWVRLPNGARAHYVTAGETGPPVILLHGSGAGSSGTAGWRLMAPFLGANGFRVYCPDQPGFGLADTRHEHWPTKGFLSHVDYLRDFADSLCLDRFHLAGNSMGAINTTYFVVEFPERVISYALIAATLADIVEPAKRVGPPRPDVNIFDGTSESMRRILEMIVYDPARITDDLVEMRTRAARAQAEPHRVFSTTNLRKSDLVQKLSLKHRLQRVRIPAIYLYGRQDVFNVVENGYLQEDVLPNIQFFYPDQCGHQGQTDQPDLFNQLFLEFLRDGQVSRATAERAGVSGRRPELPVVEPRSASGEGGQ